MRSKRLPQAMVVVLAAIFMPLAMHETATAEDTREAQWPLESFVVDELRKISTGEGVTVAVLDTGFRETHQDLRDNLLDVKKFGNMKKHPDPTRQDEDIRNHGTAMASIIAGHGHGPGSSSGVTGIAPDARILPVATDLKEEYLSEAIRYAVDEGADVINLSIARQDALIVEQALNYAIEKDVVVVAGVGNDGLSRLEYPAATPGVIGVGAVDKYGKVWEGSNYNSSVDLLAPGVDIMAAGGEADDHYEAADGTSNSTAYVSAAAALIRAEHPDLTAGQVANRLVKTAGLPDEMQGKDLPDERYGYGFIRPRAALTDDIPAGPEEGPLPMPKAGEESGLQPSTGDGPTPSLLEEWGPLVGGVTVGALVVVGGVLWLVSRSQRRSRTPVTVPGQNGLPNYPGQQGAPPYPASAPGPQPPPHQPPPPAPGQYHPGNPGPGGPGSGPGQSPYSG